MAGRRCGCAAPMLIAPGAAGRRGKSHRRAMGAPWTPSGSQAAAGAQARRAAGGREPVMVERRRGSPRWRRAAQSSGRPRQHAERRCSRSRTPPEALTFAPPGGDRRPAPPPPRPWPRRQGGAGRGLEEVGARRRGRGATVSSCQGFERCRLEDDLERARPGRARRTSVISSSTAPGAVGDRAPRLMIAVELGWRRRTPPGGPRPPYAGAGGRPRGAHDIHGFQACARTGPPPGPAAGDTHTAATRRSPPRCTGGRRRRPEASGFSSVWSILRGQHDPDGQGTWPARGSERPRPPAPPAPGGVPDGAPGATDGPRRQSGAHAGDQVDHRARAGGTDLSDLLVAELPAQSGRRVGDQAEPTHLDTEGGRPAPRAPSDAPCHEVGARGWPACGSRRGSRSVGPGRARRPRMSIPPPAADHAGRGRRGSRRRRSRRAGGRGCRSPGWRSRVEVVGDGDEVADRRGRDGCRRRRWSTGAAARRAGAVRTPWTTAWGSWPS